MATKKAEGGNTQLENPGAVLSKYPVEDATKENIRNQSNKHNSRKHWQSSRKTESLAASAPKS